MAFQQFANSVNPATTLSGNGGSITNVATTLIVASVANLPSNPNFTIGISTSGTIEWMLVTGISGTTLTVTRHQEGSSAASHNDGDSVYLVLTGGALTQILKDTSGIGTTASRPTSTTGARAGMSYKCTDSPFTFIFDGSAWQPFVNGYQTSTPPGGNFDPYAIAGLQLWLAANNLSGFSDGDFVQSWPNLAVPGDGRAAAAQATSTSNYPTYKTSIVNSLPVVRFGGSGWFRTLAPINDPQVSVFMVLKMSSLANAYTGILAYTYADLGGYFLKSNGKTALYGQSANNIWDGGGSATLVTGTFYVISLIMRADQAAARVALATDNTVTTNNVAYFNSNELMIGNHTTASRTLSGDLAELILYQGDVGSTNRDSIETYLKTKYGL